MDIAAIRADKADRARLSPGEIEACSRAQPSRTAPEAVTFTDRARERPLENLDRLGLFFPEERHRSPGHFRPWTRANAVTRIRQSRLSFMQSPLESVPQRRCRP